MALVLDAGALIAYERGDRVVAGFIDDAQARQVPVVASSAVVAQVWRSGARQARVARLLLFTDEHPLDASRSRAVGKLLGASATSDVVDAAVVEIAADGDEILTGDPADIIRIARAAGRRVAVIPI
jgi:hypothetical protein